MAKHLIQRYKSTAQQKREKGMPTGHEALQDNFQQVAIPEKLKKYGSLAGRIAVEIPSLRMTVYIKDEKDRKAVLDRYLNRSWDIDSKRANV